LNTDTLHKSARSVLPLARLPEAEKFNASLLTAFELLRAQPDRQSHFFHGRFENIYIDRKRIPEIKSLLKFASKEAGKILRVDNSKLQCGFWFNLMPPGHITTAHCHDEEDELLSGVYYVSVPEHSGNLILHTQPEKTIIQPQAGMLAFFSPAMVHEVERNESTEERLSIGMNFGLKNPLAG
jgi:hypothetical protein